MRIAAALFLAAITIAGCSSRAKLNMIQTSNNYPNKIKLKALVYIPSNISTHQLLVSPSTSECAGWKGEIDAGAGYRSAIENGLRAALSDIEIVETPPNPESAKLKGANLLINIIQQNESANLSVTSGMFSNSLNAQFQISFNLQFADQEGASLYSYTSNGSGFGTVSGSCNDIASAMQPSMETALRQVADNISQGTYGAAQIREYEKAR